MKKKSWLQPWLVGEYLTHRREVRDFLNPILFFLLVVVFFSIASGTSMQAIQRFAPAIIWLAVLLSTTLSLDSLFRADFQMGFIDKMLLCGHSLPKLVFCKIFVHWMFTGIPIILLTPIVGILLNLDGFTQCCLLVALLLGLPTLSLVGSMGVALTLGLRQGSFLLPLLVMPLYVPVLILGSSAVASAIEGILPLAQFSLLGALLSVSAVIMPLITGFALRIGVTE